MPTPMKKAIAARATVLVAARSVVIGEAPIWEVATAEPITQLRDNIFFEASQRLAPGGPSLTVLKETY